LLASARKPEPTAPNAATQIRLIVRLVLFGAGDLSGETRSDSSEPTLTRGLSAAAATI
jgi:hypothetical protein